MLANTILLKKIENLQKSRGGSSTAAISKMECFVIIVNAWKPLTIITKRSILDVAVALDLPLEKSTKVLMEFRTRNHY